MENLETNTVEETDGTQANETPSEEQSEEKSTSTEIDYEAELELERKRGTPDPEKAKEAFKEREAKRAQEQQEVTTEEEADRPLTRKELDEALARERHQTEIRLRQEQINEIALKLAESPAEAELIKEIHKNRTFPASLPVAEQLREAWAIANSKRLAAKNLELARTVQSKETASKDVATTHHDGQTGLEPKLAAGDAAALKRAGFAYNNKSRHYEKKLQNGTILVKDSIAGRPYPAK